MPCMRVVLCYVYHDGRNEAFVWSTFTLPYLVCIVVLCCVVLFCLVCGVVCSVVCCGEWSYSSRKSKSKQWRFVSAVVSREHFFMLLISLPLGLTRFCFFHSGYRNGSGPRIESRRHSACMHHTMTCRSGWCPTVHTKWSKTEGEISCTRWHDDAFGCLYMYCRTGVACLSA